MEERFENGMEMNDFTGTLQSEHMQIIPFEEVYNQYYPRLLQHYKLKMQNSHDAEDLMHEVFLYGYKNYGRFDPTKASVSTWLYVIAESRWKNYCRGIRFTESLEERDEPIPASAIDMDKAAWLEELSDRIISALSQLNEEQRKIVVLRYFDDRKPAEIAKLMGTNANRVRVMLHRALHSMQQELNDFKEWE